MRIPVKFRAKMDTRESKEYWEGVRRGAREYDNLPSWKKGGIVKECGMSTCPAPSSSANDGEHNYGRGANPTPGTLRCGYCDEERECEECGGTGTGGWWGYSKLPCRECVGS